MHISIFFSPFLSFLPSVEDVLYHEGKVDLCVCVSGGCKDVVFRWGRDGMGLPLCVCLFFFFTVFFFCLEQKWHYPACTTTPSLICWFPVFSQSLCVLLCSKPCYTQVTPLKKKSNDFWNSQNPQSSVISPTFGLDWSHTCCDWFHLSDKHGVSVLRVALSTTSNERWRLSVPAGWARVSVCWP